ncbi:N-acetyltransferase [Bacteroidia bacterium]|nr:N-acetyltransferase [Bacteroidia bacterium]
MSDLNDFLFNDAKTHLKYLSLTTFLFENNDKTIAYYSLQNDLLRMNPHVDKDFEQELDDIIFDYSFLLGMKEMSMFPASKIGRFAVDKEFQRRGYGTEILKAIATGFLDNNKTGCQFITIDALNNANTLTFYEKNGFSFVTLTDYNKPSRQMYKNLIYLKQISDQVS